MKLKKLATLVAVAGITLSFGGVNSFAADKTLGSDIDVIFTAPDDSGTDKPIVDPEDPDNQPPGTPDPIPGPGTGGLLSIDFASSFNFGSNVITNGAKTLYAAPQAWIEDGGAHTTKPNFVQVNDNRMLYSGWTLKVAQADQLKTSDNKVLDGATITLNNISVDGIKDDVTTNGPATAPTSLVITPGAGTANVMAAADGKGGGTFVARFGDETENTNDVSKNKAVKLSIPSTTQVYAKAYSGTLTWTLSDTPTTI
ncbi:MAG: WxL domain-containing protein [Clostridioides sp.]|nr:WxL domain-containing protein [Clostridioides sp.]